MTPEPTLTSRTIGETENALRAILVRGLVGTGLDYPRWVALKVTAESPAPISADDVGTLLQGGLKIDRATATGVLEALRASGMVTATPERDEAIEVTALGAALYRRLNDEFTQLTRQMYTGLEPDELAAAYRVLSTITERANLLLAS